MFRAFAIAAGAVGLIAVSGGAERPAEPIAVAMPGPYFEARSESEIKTAVRSASPLGATAPPWARRLYEDSLRVLLAFTDPESGAQIAGARERWDHVWPRDAAAGALAFEAAGTTGEAERVREFLRSLPLGDAARFSPEGEPVPGRGPAGDAEGWIDGHAAVDWRGRQDYGENVSGDLLGNAIAGGAPGSEIRAEFLGPRGLVRQAGSGRLDSAAAWAVFPFRRPGLEEPVRRTLLVLAAGAGTYGIEPMEGWSPGEAWTAPTAWSARALVALGEVEAADRLLAGLRRAVTDRGTLPERVDAESGEPTSTTPLAWSHAWAILALRARYGSGG